MFENIPQTKRFKNIIMPSDIATALLHKVFPFSALTSYFAAAYHILDANLPTSLDADITGGMTFVILASVRIELNQKAWSTGRMRTILRGIPS